MNNQDYTPEANSVLEKRPHPLMNKKYQGFSIDSINKKWNGIKITATNSTGMKVSGSGDTEQEAVNKIINQIDLLFDQ